MSQNNINKSYPDRSRVWAYFKPCDGDPSRVRCNLCSTELRHKGSTTLLWNHVKFKHSISKTKPYEEKTKNSLELSMTSTKPRRSTTTTTTTITSINSKTQLTNAKKDRLERLGFFLHDDSTLTSMKPIPSTSLSKNLISRLNQLSSPVTRKLKFWNKKSFQVNQYDPSFKVIYLGNLAMQLWSKDESCLDKPLSTLWNNYLVNMQTEIVMRLTICNSGLKAITRQHGLTQYWSNRLVYCCSIRNFPRVFSWVYRHEGKKMRHELRCHAVLCPSSEKANEMVTMLNQRLACALQEFRREKKSTGVTILNSTNPAQQRVPRVIPLRRQILAKGSANFRPPLERSKSAPKLTSILEEDYDSDEPSQNQFEFYESSSGREDLEESTTIQEEEEEDAKDLNTANTYQDSQCDEDKSYKADEDSTHKFDSNSLNTTLNEEISSSSVGVTGDKSFDKQYELSEQGIVTRSTNGISADDSCKGSFAFTTDTQLSLEESLKFEEEFDGRTKESLSSSSTSKTDQLVDLRSSANKILISSFKEHKVDDNQNTTSRDNTSSTLQEAKIISINSKRESPHTDDDLATQEIILSWPNLVIN